jgi:hypothetical protein
VRGGSEERGCSTFNLFAHPHFRRPNKGANPEPPVLALMGRNETAQLTIIDQLRQRRTYMRTIEVMELLDVTRAPSAGGSARA